MSAKAQRKGDVMDIEKAIAKVYALGQSFWQYADSERVSDYKRADRVIGQFNEVRAEIVADYEALNAKFDKLNSMFASTVEKHEALRERLNEIHLWAVCAPIASADDMMQNIERVIELSDVEHSTTPPSDPNHVNNCPSSCADQLDGAGILVRPVVKVEGVDDGTDY